MIPGKAAERIYTSTYSSLFMPGYQPRYSASPPQTPASQRSWERVSRLLMGVLPRRVRYAAWASVAEPARRPA